MNLPKNSINLSFVTFFSKIGSAGVLELEVSNGVESEFLSSKDDYYDSFILGKAFYIKSLPKYF